MRRLVVKGLTAFAGLLFLVSTLNPFVSAQVFGLIGGRLFVQGKLWSFKGDLVLKELVGPWAEIRINVSTEENWFANYWGLGYASYSGGFLRMDEYGPSALALVFIAQIATLVFTGLSLLSRRFAQILLLGAVVFSSVSFLGVLFFSQGVRQVFTLEPGFWLTLASALLYSATYVVSSLITRSSSPSPEYRSNFKP